MVDLIGLVVDLIRLMVGLTRLMVDLIGSRRLWRNWQTRKVNSQRKFSQRYHISRKLRDG